MYGLECATLGSPFLVETAIGAEKNANGLAFPLRPDHEPFFLPIKTRNQDVGLATHLAVFHVALQCSRRFVDLGNVPLAAVAAMKSAGHVAIVT